MQKYVPLLIALLIAIGIMVTPVISTADPGDGNGYPNSNAGGNGNHYGWLKGNDDSGNQSYAGGRGGGWGSTSAPQTSSNPQPVPEPLTLILLSSGIAGMALLRKKLG